jgi:hypothetical protein
MTFNELREGETRVKFERPLDARIMAIDGTWCRECLLIDVSETGAQIKLTSPAADLAEFFSRTIIFRQSRLPPLQKSIGPRSADRSFPSEGPVRERLWRTLGAQLSWFSRATANAVGRRQQNECALTRTVGVVA